MSRVTLATNKSMTFPAIAICNVNKVDCNQTYHYVRSNCNSRNDTCPMEKLCRLFNLARCDIVMSYLDNAAIGALNYKGVVSQCGEVGSRTGVPFISMEANTILSTLSDVDRLGVAQDRSRLVKYCSLMGTPLHPACINFRKGLQVMESLVRFDIRPLL